MTTKHYHLTLFEYELVGQLSYLKILGIEVYRRIGSNKNVLGLNWRK